MRIVQYLMLSVVTGGLAACALPFLKKPVVIAPVYVHVPCRTPGALPEEPIDLSSVSPGSNRPDAQSGSATVKTPTCVIERRPKYRSR